MPLFVLPFPAVDPVLIQLGPFAIRWYALAYIAGLLGAWWLILRLLKIDRLWAGAPFNGKPQATADHVGDLFLWAALGVIVGGRLGYVLFYGLRITSYNVCYTKLLRTTPSGFSFSTMFITSSKVSGSK